MLALYNYSPRGSDSVANVLWGKYLTTDNFSSSKSVTTFSGRRWRE